MLIKVRRKLVSIPVKYDVKNEQTDAILYKVKGKMFSITGKVFVKDMDGNKLMMIKRKLFTVMPQYRVYDSNKQLLFTLNRKFSAKTNFDITGTADDIQIAGEVFGMVWKFVKNNVEIATITKELINLASVYHIDLTVEQDADLVVATVVAIDRCFSKNDGNSYN